MSDEDKNSNGKKFSGFFVFIMVAAVLTLAYIVVDHFFYISFDKFKPSASLTECRSAEGFNWCQRRNVCLQEWREPCSAGDELFLEQVDAIVEKESKIKDFQAQITDVVFKGPSIVFVEYLDGPTKFIASLEYVLDYGSVNYENFTIVEEIKIEE